MNKKEIIMQIQFNTDHTIDSSESLEEHVSEVLRSELTHFSEHITRVEAHIRNESIDKIGSNDNIHCKLEARFEGRQPIVVTHFATTLDDALNGAAGKLHRLIEHTIGRLNDNHVSESTIHELNKAE